MYPHEMIDLRLIVAGFDGHANSLVCRGRTEINHKGVVLTRSISLSFSNGLLYITLKKKPIFGVHIRFFFLCKVDMFKMDHFNMAPMHMCVWNEKF